jgi:uncharacterized protein YndB with AHSA1/START domain
MHGQIIADGDRYQVRFERLYQNSIEKVFAALTIPERLAAWLGVAKIEPRQGGRFVLVFTDPPYRMEGEVRAYEPPALFEFTWPEKPEALPSLVRFALTAEGGATRLILTQTFVAQSDLASVAAGWHEHLERLDFAADGVTSTRWNKAREASLASEYRAMVGGEGFEPPTSWV